MRNNPHERTWEKGPSYVAIGSGNLMHKVYTNPLQSHGPFSTCGQSTRNCNAGQLRVRMTDNKPALHKYSITTIIYGRHFRVLSPSPSVITIMPFGL